jgi:hypothetical protein
MPVCDHCELTRIIDEDFPTCKDCIRYLRSQESLRESVILFAQKNGSELGLERAIRDTIYQHPQDEYYILPDIDIPKEVRFNKYLYARAFQDAQETTYLDVYQRHADLIQEMQHLCSKQLAYSYLIWKNKYSPLLDYQLFGGIRKYLEH